MRKFALGGLGALLLGALGGLVVLGGWLLGVMVWSLQWDAVSAATASAIFAAASAIAAAISAWANLYNTKTFERTLRNSTIDECVGAALDLQNAINRALRLKTAAAGKINSPALWVAHTEAWNARRAFHRTLTVARRYVSPDFSPKEPDEALAALLDELLPEFQTADWTTGNKESSFQQRVKVIVDDVVSKLKPVTD
jgi:hypothetical protein